MIALVDELDDWDGLDKWLESERALGAIRGRQVMEHSNPGDTVDQRLRALDPLLVWAQILGSNLRQFRSEGYDADAAAKLRDHASDRLKQICGAHGWPLPSTTIPGLKALDS